MPLSPKFNHDAAHDVEVVGGLDLMRQLGVLYSDPIFAKLGIGVVFSGSFLIRMKKEEHLVGAA